MMKNLIINPEYGMAGDMFVAALISAGAPKAELLEVMRHAASPLGKVEISITEELRNNKKGIYLQIALEDSLHGIEVRKAYEHIKNSCSHSGIKGVYRDFALKALTILGQAEENAHAHKSMGPKHDHHHPHLHEAQDIIIDLLGAAFGMQELGIDLSSIVCLSPVYVGGGSITFSHGTLDVPAPATANIIKDFELPAESGPVQKELLTPTGAAILAALEPEFRNRGLYHKNSPSVPSVMGIGFGSMRIASESEGPNALTLFIADPRK
ncbi:MAG: DUF111 family protein [Spirochaetales bacterium]|nr:DUF111 family protein [Spirochaetales bacterium]